MCPPRRYGFPDINRVKIEYRISLFSVLSSGFSGLEVLNVAVSGVNVWYRQFFVNVEPCFWKRAARVQTSHQSFSSSSGQDGSQILKVNKVGADSGLRVMLNIEHHDYFSLHARQAGLKVLIHHHETPPIVDQLGFAVGPGTSTFAAIKKEKVRNGPLQLLGSLNPNSDHVMFSKSSCNCFWDRYWGRPDQLLANFFPVSTSNSPRIICES